MENNHNEFTFKNKNRLKKLAKLDKNYIVSRLMYAIGNNDGDMGRNQYLLKRIKKDEPIFESDKKYLNRILELDIDEIYKIKINKSVDITKKDKSVFLNPNLTKCALCDIDVQLNEKSVRYQNKWYHLDCFKIISKEQIKSSENRDSKQNVKPKIKKDPIQLVLTVTIFIFLIASVYFILGPISMMAMGLGGFITIYHIIGSRKKLFSTNVSGKRGPSMFLLFLLGSPFIIAAMIAYEGYTLLESPVRIILLWAMTISFWSTMLFVPMAVVSKYREDVQPDVKTYPTISIIIPAYNEEKVIANTIEGLLETKYPKKEIIFVDDGSKDRTLDIAMQYKDKIKVLHKENGGKASALNYGLIYATGEIIVIVDADTIIGRHSLKEIVRGFEVNEHVGAVAGGIRKGIETLIPESITKLSVEQSFIRRNTRIRMQEWIGLPKYALAEYEKIKRFTFYLKNDHLLLVSTELPLDSNLLVTRVSKLI